VHSTDSFHASDGAEGAGDGIRPCIQNVSKGGRGERDRKCSGSDLLKHTVNVVVVASDALSTRESDLESILAQYNAVYTLLWKRGEDGIFRVVDEYTLQSRKRF
jgi:hypothetical protein